MPDLNFTDEQLQALAQLGVSQDKLQQLKGRYQLAQTMRQQGAPQGQHTGRTFVASNPLEHLGRGIQQYKAGRQMQDLRGDMETEQGNVSAQRAAMMARLLGGQNQIQPTPQPPAAMMRGGRRPI